MSRFFVKLHTAETEENRAYFAEQNAGDARHLIISAAQTGNNAQYRYKVVCDRLILQWLPVNDRPVIIVAVVQEITNTVAYSVSRVGADLN